jgi:hypothetical protein
MRPSPTTFRILRSLFEENNSMFHIDAFYARIRLSEVPAYIVELKNAIDYGLILQSSLTTYLFTAAFVTECQAEIDKLQDSPFTTPKPMIPYTALVTYPTADDKNFEYRPLYVKADNPAAASTAVAASMKAGGYKVWHQVALMPGTVQMLNSKDKEATPPNILWIEVDDMGAVNDIYSEQQQHVAWYGISWAEVLQYGSMDELSEEDPILHSNLVEFNQWCKLHQYTHSVGLGNLQYALDNPSMPLENLIVPESTVFPEEGAEEDQMLDAMAREDARAEFAAEQDEKAGAK